MRIAGSGFSPRRGSSSPGRPRHLEDGTSHKKGGQALLCLGGATAAGTKSESTATAGYVRRLSERSPASCGQRSALIQSG